MGRQGPLAWGEPSDATSPEQGDEQAIPEGSPPLTHAYETAGPGQIAPPPVGMPPLPPEPEQTGVGEQQSTDRLLVPGQPAALAGESYTQRPAQPPQTSSGAARQRRWPLFLAWGVAAVSLMTAAAAGFLGYDQRRDRELVERELARTQLKLEQAQDELSGLRKDYEAVVGAGVDLLIRLDEAKEIVKEIDRVLERAQVEIERMIEHFGRAMSDVIWERYYSASSELEQARANYETFQGLLAQYRQLRSRFDDLVKGLPT